MKFKSALIILVLLIIGFNGQSFAVVFRDQSGNPNDTPAGTIITAEIETSTLDYDDSSGNPKPQLTTTTIETVVAAEHGVAPGVTPTPRDGENYYYQNTSPGIPVSWELIGTSEGNADLNFRATIESLTYANGAGNWLTYWNYNGSNVGQTWESTFPDNESVKVQMIIWPATAEADSPPNSTGSITFYTDAYGITQAGSEGQGYYTGANGYRYGGWIVLADNARAYIFAPNMLLTREAYVDSPTEYTQGGAYEPVPGACITYTYEYNNTGNGTAESVIIVAKVPTYANAAHVNASATELGSFISITPAKSTATSWEVWYSTSSSPDKSYGSTSDWTILGTIESDSNWWNYPSDDDFPLGTTYFKFEKASVAPGENETLTWGVAIR